MNNIILGIDIGGSHITAALVSLDAQEVLPGSRVRQAIDSMGTAEAIVTKWGDVIRKSFMTYDITPGKIGIAMPGPFDYDIGISEIQGQNKYDELYGLNIKKMLAEKLAVSTENIQFINDAECFLQGEAFCGAAKGYKSALGITLGTGLGTALYKDGIAKDAALWSSPFRDGIAEDYLSSGWFLQRYHELTGSEIGSVKALAGVAETNIKARGVFEEFGTNLSEFLVPYFLKHKPQVLVVGGNIAKASNLFLPVLKESLQEQSIDIALMSTKLGEEAAIIGAASCWMESHSESL